MAYASPYLLLCINLLLNVYIISETFALCVSLSATAMLVPKCGGLKMGSVACWQADIDGVLTVTVG